MLVQERIINVAIELMQSRGIKSTTMDALATYLSISKKTIYEHFEDKYKLIEACIARVIEIEHNKLDEVKSYSSDIMEEIFNTFKMVNHDGNKLGKIAEEIKRYYPELFEQMFMQHYKFTFHRMSANLQEGIEQELILKNTNISFAVYTIMTAINSLLVNPEKLFITTNVEPENAFRYVIIYFFRGIATNKGIEKIDGLIKVMDIK